MKEADTLGSGTSGPAIGNGSSLYSLYVQSGKTLHSGQFIKVGYVWVRQVKHSNAGVVNRWSEEERGVHGFLPSFPSNISFLCLLSPPCTQSSYLWNGNNDIYLIGLLSIHVKSLGQYLACSRLLISAIFIIISPSFHIRWVRFTGPNFSHLGRVRGVR